MKQFKFKHFIQLILCVLGISVVLAGVGLMRHSHYPDVAVEGTVPDLTPISTTIAQKQVDESVPDVVKPCLPDDFATAELIAKVKDGDQTLYQIRILAGDTGDVPLIAVAEGKCKVLNSSVDDEFIPLRNVVQDPKILNKLLIEGYTKTFKELGGKEEFQKVLDEEATSGESLEIDQENYDVLVEMGVKIPKEYKVIGPKPEAKP